jgi:hypothetical protein
MAEERRGYTELIDSIKDLKTELKTELKEGIKEVKQDIKDHIEVNNKIYFNGFPPDVHVAHHHGMDNVIEAANRTRSKWETLQIEVLKVAVVALITWGSMVLWNGFKTEVQAPFDNKPKVEQNAKNH